MNQISTQLAVFPAAVILSALVATFSASGIKRIVKNKINAQNEKELSEKLSNVWFLVCLLSSVVGYFVNVLVNQLPVILTEMLTFTVCSLSASELIYSVYEKVGLKKLIKWLLEMLSKRSSTNNTNNNG